MQPKVEMDLEFESTKLSTPWGYLSAVALCVTTFGTSALTSGFFLKPDATIDDYLNNVAPLFGGFLTILAVSEVFVRLISQIYGPNASCVVMGFVWFMVCCSLHLSELNCSFG